MSPVNPTKRQDDDGSFFMNANGINIVKTVSTCDFVRIAITQSKYYTEMDAFIILQ